MIACPDCVLFENRGLYVSLTLGFCSTCKGTLQILQPLVFKPPIGPIERRLLKEAAEERAELREKVKTLWRRRKAEHADDEDKDEDKDE